MSVVFKQVQSAFNTPPKRDLAQLPEVLDLMVAMERDVLAFMDPKFGLEYDYGTDIPEKLPGKYPCIVHYLGEGGARMTSLMMGGSGSLAAHPGGIRDHVYNIVIFVALGSGKELKKDVLAKSLPWLKALDLAYSANGCLGTPGRVKGVRLVSAHAGNLEYAQEEFFGWLINAVVDTQFLMEAG